jgi:hypothetical protein
MSDHDLAARRAEAVTIERWEYANPSWIVMLHHPVITTALDGKPVEEMMVEVEHRATGALALITHRISERA